MLRKTSLGAQYVVSKFNGKNESGVRPIGDSVLIMCDDSVEKTAGGIVLTDTQRERDKLAAETGVVVAAAPGAFLWSADRARPFEGEKPKAGDRVYFQRYSGQLIIGRDGNEYRMMTDTCIGGVEAE